MDSRMKIEEATSDQGSQIDALFSWDSRAERLNTATHALGAALSTVGAIALLAKARLADPLQQAACSVYAASLVAVYFASTLSHLFLRERWRRFFRILDQGCIYLLIAATFTPFAVLTLSGPWWMLLALVWVLALYGFWRKIAHKHKIERASVVLPLVIGWAPAVSFTHMAVVLPAGAIALIVAGGLCYTLGVVVLQFDGRRHWVHAAWHLLVIAGSATHYAAVYRYAAG
jgi:hemolysin III